MPGNGTSGVYPRRYEVVGFPTVPPLQWTMWGRHCWSVRGLREGEGLGWRHGSIRAADRVIGTPFASPSLTLLPVRVRGTSRRDPGRRDRRPLTVPMPQHTLGSRCKTRDQAPNVATICNVKLSDAGY